MIFIKPVRPNFFHDTFSGRLRIYPRINPRPLGLAICMYCNSPVAEFDAGWERNEEETKKFYWHEFGYCKKR